MENPMMSAARSSGSDEGAAARKTLQKTEKKKGVWLIAASCQPGGTVPHDYEPNIHDMQKYGLESARLAARIGGVEPLTADEKEKIPKILVVGRTKSGKVPAVIGWNIGPFIVNETVRSILEELEPGVHTFHPITVKPKDGKPIDGEIDPTYYILLQPPVVDCMDYDRTTWGDHGTGRAAFEKYHHLTTGSGRITLRASEVAGRHFWRPPPPLQRYFFCSEAFKARLTMEKIRGWDFVREADISSN